MNRRQYLGATGAFALLGLLPKAALSNSTDKFPNKPIRLAVPFAPGGTTDSFARLFGKYFSDQLGVPVVVENLPGGGGIVGSRQVQRSDPDGYTLLFQSPTAGVTGPLTRKTLPFDPVTGFSHIAILGITPIVLAVSNKSGISSLQELIEQSKNTDQGLSYATGGVGGGPHLSVELLMKRSGGLKALHVPYRGAGPALQDLVSGEVTFMPDTFTTLAPLHESGRIRIIAVFDEARSAAAPEIPTAKEQGVDIVTRIANYVTAPPNTPPERLNLLAQAARAAMAQPEVTEKLASLAYTPITDSDPEKATRFIADEVALWRPVIQSAGIELD